MAEYDFPHYSQNMQQDPLFNVDPALTDYYEPAQRLQFDPGHPYIAQDTGIRNSRGMNRHRSAAYSELAYRGLNEMPGLPRNTKAAFKKLQQSGVGQDVARDLLGQQDVQTALGGDVGSAFGRMLANAPAFSQDPKRALDYGNLPALRAQQLETTAKFGSELRDKIYSDPSGKYTFGGYRGVPGGEGAKAGTYGLKPEDAINAVTYQAQFGGELSSATSKPGAKMAAASKTMEALSKVMEIAGTKDFESTIRAFKQLEGKNFGDINKDEIIRKFNKIGKMANAAGMAPAAMLQNMSQGSKIYGAITGTGEGTAYDAPGANEGHSERYAERAMARMRLEGKTDAATFKKYNEQEAVRSANQMNTRGGRYIDLLTRAAASGTLTEKGTATVKEALERYKAGGSAAADYSTVESATGLTDIKSTIDDETAFHNQQAVWNKGKTAGELRETNIASENNRADRNVAESKQIDLQARGKTARNIMDAAKRKLGVGTWDKEASTRIDTKAYSELRKRIADDPDMDPEAKKEQLARLTHAEYNGEKFTATIATMGAEGGASGKTAQGYGNTAYANAEQAEMKSGKYYGEKGEGRDRDEIKKMGQYFKVKGKNVAEIAVNLAKKKEELLARQKELEGSKDKKTGKYADPKMAKEAELVAADLWLMAAGEKKGAVNAEAIDKQLGIQATDSGSGMGLAGGKAAEDSGMSLEQKIELNKGGSDKVREDASTQGDTAQKSSTPTLAEVKKTVEEKQAARDAARQDRDFKKAYPEEKKPEGAGAEYRTKRTSSDDVEVAFKQRDADTIAKRRKGLEDKVKEQQKDRELAWLDREFKKDFTEATKTKDGVSYDASDSFDKTRINDAKQDVASKYAKEMKALGRDTTADKLLAEAEGKPAAPGDDKDSGKNAAAAGKGGGVMKMTGTLTLIGRNSGQLDVEVVPG